jgi:hypothetical protein
VHEEPNKKGELRGWQGKHYIKLTEFLSQCLRVACKGLGRAFGNCSKMQSAVTTPVKLTPCLWLDYVFWASGL